MNERRAQSTGSSSHSQLLVYLMVVFVGGIAIYNNLHKGVWVDEMFSFDTARGSLARTFHQALHFERQPPLYFLLLNLMLRLSPSMEFGRLLSTAAVLASLPVVYKLAKILKLSSPLRLPLLVALCPYVLWAASEGRPYGLVVLMTTLATYLFVRLLTADSEGLPHLTALYVGIWYLTLLTFYYSGALLAAQVVAAVIIRRRAGRVLAAAAVVGLLLLPWLPTIWWQASTHPRAGFMLDFDGNSLLERGWIFLHWGFQYAIHAIFMAPALQRPVVQAVLVLSLVAIVAGYWRTRTSPLDALIRVFIVTGILTVAMLLTLKLVPPGGVEQRYFGIAVVNVLSLIALVADRFPSARVGRFLGGSILLFGVLSVVGFQRNNRRALDWEAAARFVSTREAPGDVIFVFEPDAVLPFKYYYRGARPVFGMPIDRPTDVYSIEREAIHSIDQVDARVKAKATCGEFWVVARRPGPWFKRVLLDTYLREHASLLVEDPPGGVDVRQYRLSPSDLAIPPPLCRDLRQRGGRSARTEVAEAAGRLSN